MASTGNFDRGITELSTLDEIHEYALGYKR